MPPEPIRELRDLCAALHQSLADACARSRELEHRVRQLEAENADVQVQLAEMAKLCELQQADLERYKKAYESSQPNHPERAPREQLQLAFRRVLEQLGEGTSPANDGQEFDASGVDTDDGADTGDVPDIGNGAGTGNGPKSDRGRRSRPKKRHRHGRRRLDTTSLPVVEQRIEPDEVKATGGVGFEQIGEEVSERIALRPAEWVRFRVIRPKYVFIGMPSESKATEEPALAQQAADSDEAVPIQGEAKGSVQITIAPLPAGIWPNVMGDPSAISQVIISKYDDLLPLNRQQSISARGGFLLPKSTQCGWLKEANLYCAPVVDAMFEESRQRAFLIATDATSARVLPPRLSEEEQPQELSPGERRRCESWHVFVFIADSDHIVFRYDREHTGAVFAKLLAGYHGNLLADAASVFDVLYRDHGMTELGCWLHCRRPFYRALPSDPPRALEALALISKLFEVDRELRAEKLDLETFTQLRRERSEPILKLFDDWIALNRSRVDPRSPLHAAIGYYENQRDALHRFLADGRIRLSNNWSEQALRKLVVGLANWIFFANETGIAWYTTFRSLIASCILHRLNPQIYLEQLLRLAPHWPKQRMLELSPKYWAATVAQLGAEQRAILQRPWDPETTLSAELEPLRDKASSATNQAA